MSAKLVLTCVDYERTGSQPVSVLDDNMVDPDRHVLPTSLLQRMRKRRCFADSDLQRSTLCGEHVLLTHSALMTSQSRDLTTTAPRQVSRDTAALGVRYICDDHDVKTTSCGHSAAVGQQGCWHDVTTGCCHVILHRGRSSSVGRHWATSDHQLERHDVTVCKSSSCCSSRHVTDDVTMTSLTTTAVQRLVQMSSSSPVPSSSSSSSSSSSLTSSLPKTTLSFSVESLLAKQ